MRILATCVCPVCNGEKGFSETVVYDSGKKIKTVSETCLNCNGTGVVHREIQCIDFAVLDE